MGSDSLRLSRTQCRQAAAEKCFSRTLEKQHWSKTLFTYPSAKAPAEGNDAAQNIYRCWLCGPVTPDSFTHFQCYKRASRRSPLDGLSHFQDVGQELLLWSVYILAQVCSDCWTYVIRISLCSAALKIQIPQCVCPFDTRHSFTDISGAISGTRYQSQNAFLQSSFFFQSICIIYRRLGNFPSLEP